MPAIVEKDREMAPLARLLLAWPLLAAGLSWAAPEPDAPRTFALVSAVGDRFTVVHEVQSTGSHLPPYRRDAYRIAGNVLNRLVLQGLDAAVARVEPQSRRVYLSTDPGRAGIEHVRAELRKQDRSRWDRILVALPAHRIQSREGLAGRLEGLGLFAQPLCQSDATSCSYGFRPPSGPEALEPGGETRAANTFVAPYSFVEVWTLDPVTLAVLERNASFSHRKLADEKASLAGIVDGSRKEFLARQIVELVTQSADDAVNGGALGTVEVKEKGPIR
jgi:hypothetical protein